MVQRKRKRSQKRSVNTVLLALIVLLLCFLGVLIASRLQLMGMLNWVSPGWEIYNKVAGMNEKDVIYTEASQFTTPAQLMGVYWKVDIDEPNYQVPTMMCELSDIFHTDFSGQPVPWDTAADSRIVTRGNTTYFLDYHIYVYTVTIRTVGDRNPVVQGPGLPPKWEHETSYPYSYEDPIVKNTDWVGDTFNGGFYTKFVILPWRGVGYVEPPPDPDEDTYWSLDGCWAGVMNSYVIQKDAGQIENQWGDMPDPNTLMRVAGGLDVGHQVPMFEDDGTFGEPAPVVNWGSEVTPDTRIESTVVHFLPIDMDVGAKVTFNWLGQTADVQVCDVYIQYKVRVDVLQTHEFLLVTGDPPNPDIPNDFFNWFYGFWETLLGNLNPFAIFGEWGPLVAFFTTLVLGAVIILVVVVVFFPWVLPRAAKSLHDTQQEWKGSNLLKPPIPPW